MRLLLDAGWIVRSRRGGGAVVSLAAVLQTLELAQLTEGGEDWMDWPAR